MRHHPRHVDRLKIHDVPAAIAARSTFKADRLRGGYEHDERVGNLPEEYRDAFAAALADEFVYVVRSGRTPIAWRTFLGGWLIAEVPGVPESHLRAVRQAIDAEITVDPYELVG